MNEPSLRFLQTVSLAPASTCVRQPSLPCGIEPVAHRLAGAKVGPEPQHVVVEIHDLTLARAPRIVRRRMSQAGAASLQLSVNRIGIADAIHSQVRQARINEILSALPLRDNAFVEQSIVIRISGRSRPSDL